MVTLSRLSEFGRTDISKTSESGSRPVFRAPIGPWLVTADEVPDPQNLRMWLEVNGKRYQNGNTNTMVFSVAHLVSYISQFMTLNPGDVISTGTPPGVGLGQKPEPVYLKAGDQIRLGIEGLGEQNQTVYAWDSELIDS